MAAGAAFVSSSPFQKDVLALPVTDVDAAAAWYSRHFGMELVARSNDTPPSVILERDGVRIGFAVTGGDAEQDGAAIRVRGLDAIRAQMEASGLAVGPGRIDERDGHRFNVFFVVAPDGLCFYFHEELSA